MKTITTKITIIALLLSAVSIAQVKHSFEAETEAGYEYNYFRSPGEVHQNGQIFTASDLIESSIYQDIRLDYDFRKRWGKNRIRFSASPWARLYYENLEDSYWSLSTNVKYDYRLNRDTRILGEVSFKRRNREGLGGDQDVLINPLGYSNYGVKAGARFEPIQKNKTTVLAFYNFRDFDEFGVRDLQYDEFGIQFRSEQEFEVNNLEHEYGITGYVRKRLYDTFNASNVITAGERDWDYLKLTGYYNFPISKNFKIRPSYEYFVRVDNKNSRSNFNQFGPSIRLRYDNKKTTVRSTFRYLTRNYTNLEARDNNGLLGENIKYNYALFNLDAEHQLESGLILTATVYSFIRDTNFTDVTARSFRGYTNQYAGVGVKWKI